MPVAALRDRPSKRVNGRARTRALRYSARDSLSQRRLLEPAAVPLRKAGAHGAPCARDSRGKSMPRSLRSSTSARAAPRTADQCRSRGRGADFLGLLTHRSADRRQSAACAAVLRVLAWRTTTPRRSWNATRAPVALRRRDGVSAGGLGGAGARPSSPRSSARERRACVLLLGALVRRGGGRSTQVGAARAGCGPPRRCDARRRRHEARCQDALFLLSLSSRPTNGCSAPMAAPSSISLKSRQEGVPARHRRATAAAPWWRRVAPISPTRASLTVRGASTWLSATISSRSRWRRLWKWWRRGAGGDHGTPRHATERLADGLGTRGVLHLTRGCAHPLPERAFSRRHASRVRAARGRDHVAPRLGRIRISPHVYNDEEDVDRFVAAFRRLARTP